MQFPVLLFLLSFLGLWLSVKMGVSLRVWRPLGKEEREDFSLVQVATLGLLSLIIGFSFSMAVSRYDQRKNREEEEANAIGTEFLRVGLLPPAGAAKIEDLLRKYVDQRIAFYRARSPSRVKQINSDTAQLQAELWAAMKDSVQGQPTSVAILSLSGMNDVLNSQGYTQAVWNNRIPVAAWIMMEAIAFFAILLVGIGSHRSTVFNSLLLPLAIAVAFLLIADLDSPRGGLIRVYPRNLLSVSESLKAH